MAEAADAQAHTAGETPTVPLPLVCLIFFLSGGPALIYQLIWQRSLFAIYGINVESVTVIVAAFMMGLGLGSILGGVVSKRPGVPLLLVFGAIELGIGVFGLGSLALFAWVGKLTIGLPALMTGVVTFLLVLIPTLLMGSTLPILVAFLVNRSGNVGRSVGLLYFVNTFGSAVACFLAALVLFLAFGQAGSVYAAAAMNLAVGAVAIMVHRKTRGEAPAASVEASEAEVETPRAQGLLPFPLALALVGLCGFISLSYEILWFRVYSFVSAGMAAAFGLMLGAYLAGIAFGSLLARRFCPDLSEGGRPTHIRALAAFVVAANAIGFLIIPLVARLATQVHWGFSLPLVAVAAAALGAAFPLIAHLGIAPGPRAGAQVSYLYLANIIGSSVGSLLTGFILMDHLTIQGISVFLALLGLALGAALVVPSRLRGKERGLAWGGVGLAALAVVLTANPLFDQLYERLWRKERFEPEYRFRRVIETKSGVVTVGKHPHPQFAHQKDHVFGGGIYDGVFSVDPVDDQNMIFRAYAISLLHPAPKKMLSIGLASGSWAQVMAHHPQVEELTLIEINAGYLKVIPDYPEIASVLTHPKVKLVIDDGRRFLVGNDEQYDVIVMNSTYNWRAHATNLLSQEFLTEVKRHLKPGGFMMYNTTSAPTVQRTGCTVFPHAILVGNFLAVSNDPFPLDIERWKRVLLSYEINGKRMVDMTRPADRERVERLTTAYDLENPKSYLETRDSILKRTEGARLVTDDNMGTEWAVLYKQ